MGIKNKPATQTVCLQKNLSIIRKTAGWTSEQLGEMIGVTKQSISNLENWKTSMTLIQYIAIRTIIDFEILTNKENTVLPQVVDILLDRDEKYTDEKREKITEAVKAIAAIASKGIKGSTLATVSTGLLGEIFGTSFLEIGKNSTGLAWLSKILKDKKK
jgi:DNA-binding XRE family transcriptional regulator